MEDPFSKSMEAPRTYTVLADYEVIDPNPLRLEPGQVVDVIRNDSTWPGWQWVRLLEQRGWVPEDFLKADNGATARVVKPFDGSDLSARRGTQLTALDKAPGWIYARHPDGQKGWFPLFNLKPDQRT